MLDDDQYKLIHPVKYFRELLTHNFRPDGREKSQFRPVALNVSSVSTADGSAVVKLGNTTVVCGIKAELAEPKAAEPECGFIVPNIELSPLCSSKFRPGAPTEEAQVLSQTLNHILTNSKCFDRTKLCVAKERLVWVLYCDVVCLNHDGCVLDASVLAAMCALKTLTLPVVTYHSQTRTYKVEQENRVRKFELDSVPVSSTFMLFDDLIVDPTAEEEQLSLGNITVVTRDSEIVYLLQSGGISIDPKQLDKCIEINMTRSRYIQALVLSVFKDL